mgnify:CR=1 FL=1
MRNILLTLEFDGTDFSGWQIQPGQRTVQGELENILRRMLGHPELRATGSGRTDSGVHAYGMRASFSTDKDIPLEGLVRGLNSQLPLDVRVLSAREVPLDLCARRWSRGKKYRYRIWNHFRASAIDRKRAWHIAKPLDIEALREAASYLVGRHDFSAFRAARCASKHAVRDLWEIKIYQEGCNVYFEFFGSAFVRHMVRNLMGSLVEVGKGLRPPEWIQEVLRSRDRRNGGKTAPPHGLYMMYVLYDLPPAKNASQDKWIFWPTEEEVKEEKKEELDEGKSEEDI